MGTPETEILVHTAAPARAVDDVKYRTLAAAYLDFEPITYKSIVPGSAAENRRLTRLAIDNTDKALSQAGKAPQSQSASFEFIQSPMLSFQSVTHNFGSPGLQCPEPEKVVESPSSWVAPPSEVQDSVPDNDSAFAPFCTPTRILAHYTSTLDTSPFSERRQPQALPVSSPFRRRSLDQKAHREDGNNQQQAPHEDPGMVIPRSPGGGPKRRRPPTPTTSGIIEETRIESSYPSQPASASSSFRAESEPPLPKRPRKLSSRDPSPGKPLARSASDIGPQQKQKQQQQPNTHTHTPSPSLASLPTDLTTTPTTTNNALTIHSPPPSTSPHPLHPSDLITPVLARLATTLDLPRRFQPTSQTRPLRPFERGYWRVDCRGWPPPLKRSAWGFMADYLGKGAAGWGTWCTRDGDGDGDGDEKGGEGFGWLRVYCWGGVVGHMYLVVYLMSRRRVLETGAEWVGAEGEAVVVVGARPGVVVKG